MTGGEHSAVSRWRLSLVLCSCVFLAWSIQRAVAWDLKPAPAESSVHDYWIRVPPHPAAHPAAYDNEIWLHDVLVEGQPLKLEALQRIGTWDDRGWALVHTADDESGAIRIRGRRVTISFLTSPSSGIVRVENGRGEGWDVDLYHPDRPRTTLAVLDFADGQLLGQERSEDQHVGIILLALVPLFVAAAAWRPWKSSTALEAWGIAYIVGLHLLVWLTQPVGYNQDAHGYTEGFAKFVEGVSSFFPPGYSFFLAPWQSLFPGATGWAVSAAQHVVMVVTLVALSRLAREVLPADFAIAGLFLAGSLAPTLFLPQSILAENVALFSMAGALWVVCRPAGVRPVLLDAVAGVLVGWATLARVVPLTAVIAPLLLVLYVKRGTWMRAARGTARVLAIALLTLAATSSWILYRSMNPIDQTPREREFRLANSTGYHMYNRVVRQQRLFDPDGPMTRVFLSKVGRNPDGSPRPFANQQLIASGMSYEEIAALFKSVSIEALRRYPFHYVAFSVYMAVREYQADPAPHVPRWEAAREPVPSLNDPVPLGLNASSILWRQENDKIFSAIWPMLFWMPFAGLVVLPRSGGRTIMLAMLLIPAGYLFGTSSVEVFLERHIVCVVAFALVLVPAPLVRLPALFAWLSRKFSRPEESALIRT